ncbi:MAG: NAD-dependent epimerase/dehydratase family protein [Nitriliruptoraceae bacterium]
MARVRVLGAKGGLGAAITAELAARGHDVTAVSRHGDTEPTAGVERVAADLAVLDDALRATAGSEVVVMAAQVPYARWAGELPALVEHALAGAVTAGARLVMCDNLYAYGAPGAPISEATPERPGTRKGTLRAALGQRLLRAHHDGRLGVTLGRFSDYYGPGGTNSALYALGVGPALAGKPLRALVDADQPHAFHYLPDAARGFAELVEHPEADGRAWILPADEPVTQRELLTLVAEAAGVPPKVRTLPPWMLRVGGLRDPNIAELRELVEQWDRPYTIDASAFVEAFGPFEPTAHADAVARTVAAFREEQAAPGH